MREYGTGASVVGSQCQFLVVGKLIEQITQVVCAAPQVLRRVKRISYAVAARGGWHKLHQALRTLGRDGIRVEARFDLDYRVQQVRVDSTGLCRRRYFQVKVAPRIMWASTRLRLR